VLVDLKTIRSVTDHAIVSNCLKFNYPMSMAAYRDGIDSVGDFPPPPAYLIFVESVPPHDVAVKLIEADELAWGVRQWKKALAVIAESRDSGDYPGISEEILPLVLPEWAMNQGDEIELDWES
jgi:hypothetical protein